MVRSGGNQSYFGAERRGAKRALTGGFILEEALLVITVPWQKDEGGEGRYRKICEDLNPSHAGQ